MTIEEANPTSLWRKAKEIVDRYHVGITTGIIGYIVVFDFIL